MIENLKYFEKIAQNTRFKMAKPYLIGDVLDFGGNKGELKKLVKGKYIVVNYDHSVMENAHVDTIACLAVIEHIHVKEVYEIFNKFKTILKNGGRIVLTTPPKIGKPFMEFMAFIGINNKENIAEHKHYWSKNEIQDLAEKTGFIAIKYKRFQIVFNQLAIFEHK
jgi:predicted SAM-dependent methyltransferase